MMTSSNGNIFRVIGPFWGKPPVTGGLSKTSNTELWCFLWCSPEHTVEQKIETPVIWDAMAAIATSLLWPSWWPRQLQSIGTQHTSPLKWRHNGRCGVLNHQRLDCLLNPLFRQIKENIKVPRHWPLWVEFTGDRWIPHTINTLRPIQDDRHFPNDIFKCIFLTENAWILIKIQPKFVSMGSIDNIPALVQIMAWRRPGDKPLSEPMIISLLTHICVARPQWVKGPVTRGNVPIWWRHQAETFAAAYILACSGSYLIKAEGVDQFHKSHNALGKCPTMHHL